MEVTFLSEKKKKKMGFCCGLGRASGENVIRMNPEVKKIGHCPC